MYCKFSTDVTKTIADVYESQRPHRTSQPIRMLREFSAELTTNLPMFCKFQVDLTKTIADVLKVSTDVTETIADVLQDLYASHKDITAQVNQSECFASSQQNSQPIHDLEICVIYSI